MSLTRLINFFASLKLTVALLGWLIGATFVVLHDDELATWALAAPLTALALNLSAAVATNGIFRRNLPLLTFHLALIAIVALAATGRLVVLHGRAEVPTGGAFEGLDVVVGDGFLIIGHGRGAGLDEVTAKADLDIAAIKGLLDGAIQPLVGEE